MSYDVDPLGKVCLCDIASGSLDDHAADGAAAETYGPGELFSLSPPDRGYAGTINSARYTLTMIDPALLAEVADPDDASATVRLLDHRPLDGAARRLRAAIDHFDSVVLADPDVLAHPLLLGTASRYLAAHVLAAFPTTTARPRPADERDAHPAALRRAIAYIEEHAGADLSPAQIAAAAHVSIRSLQLAFRRHLDTTPMRYVQRVRMAKVRGELRDAATGGTVAEIASRWGFLHQGHFGQAYRRTYGETPGATRRGR